MKLFNHAKKKDPEHIQKIEQKYKELFRQSRAEFRAAFMYFRLSVIHPFIDFLHSLLLLLHIDNSTNVT